MSGPARTPSCIAAAAAIAIILASPAIRADAPPELVDRAIKKGVAYLKAEQRADGSWRDTEAEPQPRTGASSLAVLALLAAGETAAEPHVARALEHLEKFKATDLKQTYSIAMQTMAFAAADPARYRERIADNAAWLEEAQLNPKGPRRPAALARWRGSWGYDRTKTTGDNSNTQYALLGLDAAAEAGAPVRPEVWALARDYWERAQLRDGGWNYMPDEKVAPTASMTCAGISSLILCGLRTGKGRERLDEVGVKDCGKELADVHVPRGIKWLSVHFRVDENFGRGQMFKYYYLASLERAGRLTGLPSFGDHEWYREGADSLVHNQSPTGEWIGGQAPESAPVLATSFALLFLSKGRSPTLIQKLRHGPGNDWNNDPADLHNLTGAISRDRGRPLKWRVVEPTAKADDLLQAPILFLNGHKSPTLSDESKKNLRGYVERGGTIFAEACCGKAEFDRGFRELMSEVFPDKGNELRPLPADHALWTAKHALNADDQPLWWMEIGGRAGVLYSPSDLSCSWNRASSQADHPSVPKALRLGQNIVEYVAGRK